MSKRKNKQQKNVILGVYFGIVILIVAVVTIFVSLNIFQVRLSKEFVAKAGEPVQTTYDLQYQTITRAGITQTGNALTLSPTESVIKAIGTTQKDFGDVYTSLDENLRVDGYPKGTTRKWQNNGSKSTLDLPQGSEILHAQLVWSANYKHLNNPENDVSNQIDLPIKLAKGGEIINVNPNPDFAYKFVQEIPAINKIRHEYVNTANVTEFIRKKGAGEYTVSEVPGVLSREMEKYRNGSDNPDNWAGWTLVVAYKNYDLPIRSVSIFTGLQKAVAEVKNNLPALISGFETPTSGKMNAKVYISAAEGDGSLVGDQLKIGASSDKMYSVFGQNNPENNFFNSLILDKSGQIDTRGSFGNYNQSINKNLNVKRQGWDLSTVDVSNFIKPGQTQALILGTSKGDGYNINSLAIEVDVYSPQFELNLTRDQEIVNLGENIDYTLTIENKGLNEARLINIPIIKPLGTEIIKGSLESPDYALSPGNDGTGDIEVESFKVNQKMTLKYKVKVIQNPELKVVINQIPISYKYQMTKNSALLSETSKSNLVSTDFRVVDPVIKDPQDTQNPPPPPPINLPPVANDDNAQTKENIPVTIEASDNDTDPENVLNKNSIEVVIKPISGLATNKNNKIEYIPNPAFFGSDVLVYKICDNRGLCDQANINITVTKDETITPPSLIIETQTASASQTSRTAQDPQPDRSVTPTPILNQPILDKTILAVADLAATSTSQTITIPVLNNDSYNAQDQTQITLQTFPVNGKAEVEGNTIVYTSNASFVGEIDFEYNLCQYSAICSIAQVNITISKSELVTQEEKESKIPILNLNAKLPRTGADFAFWVLLCGIIAIITGFVMTTVSFYDPKD